MAISLHRASQTLADIRNQLSKRILILDGAMGTMIQGYKLEEADYRGERFKDWHTDVKGNNDLLVLTQPHIIKQIHTDYLLAGADIIETNTFNATTIAMADYDMQSLSAEINREGARLAREACDEIEKATGKPRYVAGVLGPTNRTASISPDVNDPGFRNVSFDELVDAYTESTHALIEGGADIIMLETIFDTLNAKAAAFAVMKVFDDVGFKLPVMISGTITDASGRTLSGQTTEAFYHSLAHVEPVCFGLNCALGPDLLRPYVETLSGVSEAYVSVHPNAGLPNEFGEYDLGAVEMAAEIADWAKQGFLNIVGGCCGTTPAHIQAVADAVSGKKPARPTLIVEPGLASLYQHQPFDQTMTYLSIGERTNANGSKAFREAMLEENWEECLEIARSQTREGAHLLDVCVDYVGRDGVRDAQELVSRLATATTLPLVLDSTEPAVLEAGLECMGGRAMINSVNYEDGDGPGSRFAQIVPLINGKMLEALIPHSRLEIFEQGGHLFMLTHREQTISSLRGFLNAPDREDRKAA